MNQLTTFYKELLESIDCTVNLTTGVISYQANGKEDNPIKVKVGKKEKQLILPSSELIAKGNWMESVAFHPAGENIFQGQSEVFNLLIYLTGLKLHDTIQKAVASIINLGLNKELHEKLNMRQVDLLSKFEAINKPVEDLAISVAKRSTGVVGKHPLIGFKLERGGEIDEEVYERVCRFIPYILKDKNSFLGLTSGSEKSKRVLYSIYEYVVPNNIVVGSNSKQMPYLLSFLKCYKEVAEHLNKIKEVLGKYTIMDEIRLNWVETIKHLPKLQKKYLPQPLEGNVGISLKRTTDEVKEEDKVETAVIEEPTIKQPDTSKTTLGLTKCPLPQTIQQPHHPMQAPITPSIPPQQVAQQYQHPTFSPSPAYPYQQYSQQSVQPLRPLTAVEAMRMELANKQVNQPRPGVATSHAINHAQSQPTPFYGQSHNPSIYAQTYPSHQSQPVPQFPQSPQPNYPQQQRFGTKHYR